MGSGIRNLIGGKTHEVIHYRTLASKLCINPDIIALRHLPCLYSSDNFVENLQRRKKGKKFMGCDRAILGWL